MDKSDVMKAPRYEGMANYAKVKDFKSVVKPGLVLIHGERRAIDILDGPIESYTNLTNRILCYLEDKVGTPVASVDIKQMLSDYSYDSDHVKQTLKELDSDLRVASTWEGDKKDRYYQWIEQTEDEYQKSIKDQEWFDSL